MKDYQKEYPLFRTKVEGVAEKFNLSDPEDRKRYFEAKAGKEVALIKKYLENSTFVAYFLGKKNAGKGTYTKLMMEIFGKDKIGHISVGDVVRAVHEEMSDESKVKELKEYLEKNYRGYISVDQALDALLGRDTKTLLPTEFILALVKREIDKMGRRALFIDGFPRGLDQISYSFFFRDLINFREDPDIFAAIDIPESVIDARMKNRVVCPICHTPRNLKLFTTKEVGYDEEKKEFYLKCDNPECDGARMVSKEGDDAGIESIRDRLNLDDQLMDKVFSLHGIPKILLRNAVPVEFARENVDDYEITPAYSYEYDEQNKTVKTIESPWIVKDDFGNDVYSLLAPPVALALIKELVKILKLE